MKIIDHKDAINRRLYNNKPFVETAIYRVSCPNLTVLPLLIIEFGSPFIEFGSPFIEFGSPFIEFGNPFIEFGNPFIEFGNPFVISACP